MKVAVSRRSRGLRLSVEVVAGDSLKDLPAPQSRMRLAYGLWCGLLYMNKDFLKPTFFDILFLELYILFQ
jgi:hypothetical protein